ncbi:MAG: GNAT family N-acetyltransferase [Polyangiales bacterium]
MSLTVLRATLEHVDLLTPLFDGYRQFYRQPSDLARARAFLTERLERDESVVFLALDHDDDVACGFTQLYPSFSSVRTQRTWVLNDLFVDPAQRRRGTARALLDAAHAHAAETGAAWVSLSTEQTNETAKALYVATGYVQSSDFAYLTYKLPT